MSASLEEPKKRVVDTSAREARRAVASVVSALQPLRARLAVIAARAQRSLPSDQRQSMLDECAAIEGSCLQFRSDMLAQLIDAPGRVAGHSRVADAEKAVDNLERSATLARAQLEQRPLS